MKVRLMVVLLVACIGHGLGRKRTQTQNTKTTDVNTEVRNFKLSYLATIRLENHTQRYYGSIIHNEWVLARAADVDRAGNYFVRVGGTPNQYARESSKTIEYKVLQVILHENYSKDDDFKQDVALLKVEYVDLIEERTEAVRLWDQYIKTDRLCECVSSYGLEDTLVERYSMRYIKFLSHNACRKFVASFKSSHRKVDEREDLCVKVSDYKCANLYSGWPLVTTPGWQIGFVSSAYRTETEVVYLYKRVSYYIPWIATHCEHCVYCEEYQ